MSHYRRLKVNHQTYFFTQVSYRRRKIFCDDLFRNSLREAVAFTKNKYPFQVDAWVLLPDHMHAIWTLPIDDANFSMRWSLIKRITTVTCGGYYHNDKFLTPSKQRRRESTIWQRRFYEHAIRDDNDFTRHMDYCHYNPVKHGLSESPCKWPYSTFHKLVNNGFYNLNWDVDFDDTGYNYGE